MAIAGVRATAPLTCLLVLMATYASLRDAYVETTIGVRPDVTIVRRGEINATVNGTAVALPSARNLLNVPPPYEETNVHRLSPNLAESPNTIVSAYFRLPSKHTSSQYDQWMEHFLSLRDCMVVFTSHDMVDQIGRMRLHAADRTVIIGMNVTDIPIGRLYPNDFWWHQMERDYEKAKHKSIELFWIWLGKSGFVTEAIRRDFFRSDLYLWSDVGAFRDGYCRSCDLIRHREVVPRGEMMQMAAIAPDPPPDVDVFWDKQKDGAFFYHSGMQAVAYADTWAKFHVLFLDMIDRFLERDYPICDDQVVLQSTCLTHRTMCAYVPASQVKDHRYRGLRYVLHNGGSYDLWRRPNGTAADDAR